MSSEYNIHLGDKPIRGQVDPMDSLPCVTATITVDDAALGHSNRERLILFIRRNRLLEASLLFHKIAQDLAALLPDVDACCRCVPGTPDDQCAAHGYGAFKIQAAASCPLCGKPSPGGEAHHDCIAHEEYRPEDAIPIDDVREAVEPPHRWG